MVCPITSTVDSSRKPMNGRKIAGIIYKGMNKVEGSSLAGEQYILLYNTLCEVKDWENVRAISLEVAYKILVENGIQPVSGELRHI